MASVDWGALRSPLAICKLVMTVLLLSILLLASYGNDGLRLTFGVHDFLGSGATLGLAITLPLFLPAYVCNSSLFAFEALLSLVAVALSGSIGLITLDSYDHPIYGSPTGRTLGYLCLLLGLLALINLLLVIQRVRQR